MDTETTVRMREHLERVERDERDEATAKLDAFLHGDWSPDECVICQLDEQIALANAR